MKRTVIYVVWMFVLVSAGCKKTILEYPAGEGVDPTLVHLDLALVVDPKMEPYIPARSDTEHPEEHDVRWIVEVFRDEIAGVPVARQVLGCDPDVEGRHAIQTSLVLHAARYQVVAWMEYVDDGSLSDKYYKVNSLASISLPGAGEYVGNEDHKEAYVARQEVDLRSYRKQWNAAAADTLLLQRPMAKIEFVTTDVEKFLKEMGARGVETASEAGSTSGQYDLSAFQVEVEYAGYFPSGFNAYTDKPNDARTGVSFTGKMLRLSKQKAHLASDFVFVNGAESSVIVNLAIRDADGDVLNKIEGIRVPVVRGRLTTVRDEFLTGNYTPGIGINPGFDGEISVVIPG